MESLAARCKTDKLFTSTNQSNEPMQQLLTRLGYKPSGVIYNVDPGDPELVYFRHAGAGAAQQFVAANSGSVRQRWRGRMPISSYWGTITAADWEAFASAWLEGLRDPASPEHSEVRQTVLLMNFTATPENQWQFIVATVAQAQSDAELGHIAAGPVEQLLGKHGETLIDRVEQYAATDPKFARMLTGAWRRRICHCGLARAFQAIQASVPNPLS